MSHLKNFINEVKLNSQINLNSVNSPMYTSFAMENISVALQSGEVSAKGTFNDKFESEIKMLTGIQNVILTNTGSSALQALLRVNGVKENDEVLVPAISFVATANAVIYNRAIPHFLDVEMPYAQYSAAKLAKYLNSICVQRGKYTYNKITNRRISALVVVHVFGQILDISHIKSIGTSFGIPVIEDAAGALGSNLREFHPGRLSDGAIVSFNGNKIITTGGGGAILINDDEKAILARHLISTAKVNDNFVHDYVAYNFRMPNINAALGCSQISFLPRLIQSNRKLNIYYNNLMCGSKNLGVINESDSSFSNYWQQAIYIKSKSKLNISHIITEFVKNKIPYRRLWYPTPLLKPFSDFPYMDLKGAIICYESILVIPSSYMETF